MLFKQGRAVLRDNVHGYTFLIPFLGCYLTLLIYPFFLGLWMSLHDWELLSSAAGIAPLFIGLENYKRLFSDPYFWSAIGHSALFTAMTVPVVTLLGLLLALALNNERRITAVLRSIFFVSSVFSVTVVTLVWLAILSPTRGLLGQILELTGAGRVDLLSDPRFAMPALVLVTVWWSVGMPMALFLAGLQQIPQDIYEAAALDHANRWTQFRRITLPSLRRTTWLVLVLGIISHFQVFGQVLLMTGGGPASKTKVLVQYIYESSFRDWEIGYGTAVSVILFTLMSFVSIAQLRLSRQTEAEHA